MLTFEVLFCSGVWKIGDFDLTTPGTSTRLIASAQGRGTSSYKAPELVRDPDNPQFNNKVDIWAFGCVMWEMIVGKQLFKSDGAVMQHTFSNSPIPSLDHPEGASGE